MALPATAVMHEALHRCTPEDAPMHIAGMPGCSSINGASGKSSPLLSWPFNKSQMGQKQISLDSSGVICTMSALACMPPLHDTHASNNSKP